MTAATRNEKHIRSASQVLYLALELGVAERKLAFTTDLEPKPRIRVMPARDLKQLTKEVATATRSFGLPDSTVVRSYYEAGRDGVWLHRHLTTVGIDNRVVDSGSIGVNRRQRGAKSGGLDARKLVTMLVRYHAAGPRDPHFGLSHGATPQACSDAATVWTERGPDSHAAEIGNVLNLPANRVRQVQQLALDPIPLDTAIGDEMDGPLAGLNRLATQGRPRLKVSGTPPLDAVPPPANVALRGQRGFL